MSALEPTSAKELVVADDGSIPADQLASLGLRPGAHLRVIAADEPSAATSGLAGSLPDLPDINWGDFERASWPGRISPSLHEGRRRLARHRLVRPGVASSA